MTKQTYLIFNSGTDNCDVSTKISVICLNFGQDFRTAPYTNSVYILRLKSFSHTSHYLFVTVLSYRSVNAFLTLTLSDQSILTKFKATFFAILLFFLYRFSKN